MYYYSDECFFQHKDISVSKYVYNNRSYEHMHNFFEIAYVSNGEGYHFINGKRYRITAGDYMIIDTTASHYYDGDVEILNLIFKPKFLDRGYREIKTVKELYKKIGFNDDYALIPADPLHYIYHNDDVREKILQVKDEIENKKIGYEDYARLLVMQIIIQAMRSICSVKSSNTDKSPVKYIEKYVYEHYDENISLSALSAELGYSLPYISRRFKQLTSLTFSEYLQSTRMQIACDLLTNYPEMSLEDIASKVSYSDIKYFTSIFKKYIGVTPSLFKKLNNKK